MFKLIISMVILLPSVDSFKKGLDALAACRVHGGLPVGFLLLRYSVLFTVESISLFYLLSIS